MDFIFGWLREEWRTLMRAPILIGLVLIVGLFLGWNGRGLYESHHEQALEDRGAQSDHAVQVCLAFKPQPPTAPITINIPKPTADSGAKDWAAYSAEQQKKIDILSHRFEQSEAGAKRLKWQLNDCIADGDFTKTIKALKSGQF